MLVDFRLSPDNALGELALLAISEEKTKFRLRYRFVCSVLGKPDEEWFQLALQLGWLNQVGVAAECSVPNGLTAVHHRKVGNNY